MCLELIEIPTWVIDDVLEQKVCGIFPELGVEIGQRDIQACHGIKSNRTIIKLSNRENCLQVPRAKKLPRAQNDWKISMVLHWTYQVIVKASLTKVFVAVVGGCGTSKRLKGDNKIHQFYTSNGIIRFKLIENGSVKTITHVSDLKDLFPDIDIDNL